MAQSSSSSRRYAIVKRATDIVLAIVAMVALFPVALVIAILVRIFLGSPILFRQVRPGLGGKPFVMYKFRTMRDVSDHQGRPLPDEFRLGRFGQLLRGTSLDELPELWNVLRGDMSLVGPRPLLMEYLPLYSPEQRRRHEVRPGITGWAQVNGRNAITWEEKFRLDVWYVDNMSLRLDAKILWLTLVRVLSAHGVAQAGHVTSERFRGNRP